MALRALGGGLISNSISGSSLSRRTPTISQIRNYGVGTNRSGIKEALSLQYRTLKRNSPTVSFRQLSVSNSISVDSSAVAIAKEKRLDAISSKTLYGDRFLSAQSKKFTAVSKRLASLKQESDTLVSNGNLNNKSLTTSNTDDYSVISANATSQATKGEYEVEVQRLAKSHEVASSKLVDVDAALGLTGSVRIGGLNISIVATDSLASIAEKVNYGEDSNSNGLLDGNEDINGNSQLDTINIRGGYTGDGYSSTFYYKEDVNNNGEVDGSEDTNNNELLDFNSAQSGIRAFITNDQLIIASDNPGDVGITFSDPNDILQSIGLLFKNEVTGEVVANSINDNSQVAQTASILLNGKEYEFSQNFSSSILAGITIQFKSEGIETIKVTEESSNIITPVAKFSLSYNQAVRELNSTISGRGAISENVRLQSIYTGTITSLLSAPPKSFGSFESLKDIGIIASEKKPSAIDQTAFERLSSIMKDSLAIPGKGAFSHVSQSEKIGINDEDTFTVRVSREKLEKAVSDDFNSLQALLDYTSSRLSSELDTTLNSEYGKIKFQQDVIRAYMDNRALSETFIAHPSKTAGAQIESEKNRVVFSAIG